MEEDIDEYTSEGIFLCKLKQAHAERADCGESTYTGDWARLSMMPCVPLKRKQTSERYSSVRTFARSELDKRRLGDVVDLFTNIWVNDRTRQRERYSGIWKFLSKRSIYMPVAKEQIRQIIADNNISSGRRLHPC